LLTQVVQTEDRLLACMDTTVVPRKTHYTISRSELLPVVKM